jgi:hypothetical protein
LDLLKGIQAMFGSPNPVETSKREAKEVSRQQVLIHQPTQPAYTPNAVMAQQQRDKATKAAVTRVIQTAKPPPIKASGSGTKKTDLVGTTNTKKKPTVRKRKSVSQPTPQMVPAKEPPRNRTAKLCGCRHGDLGAVKSFTKAEATWYSRPNRFMETIGCLDCASTVVNMLKGAQSQKAVVFYCDEGIKGFDAPAGDPMKEELTCNLVLCSTCMAIRLISFEKENEGRGGRGRNSRSRR